MAKWSRQTYEMVANGIRGEQYRSQEKGNSKDTLYNLALYFAGQFTADNRTFRRDDWLAECGYGKDGNGQNSKV